GQASARLERHQRATGGPDAHPGLVVSVLELEHLDDELDVDESAASRLDVHVLAVGLGALGRDALADAARLGAAGTSEPRPVDAGVVRFLERASQRGRPLDRPRLDERLPFPELGARVVVRLERLERGDQRPLVARGTQARVDSIRYALARRSLEHADGALRDS